MLTHDIVQSFESYVTITSTDLPLLVQPPHFDRFVGDFISKDWTDDITGLAQPGVGYQDQSID
jgi:hypothetical protein